MLAAIGSFKVSIELVVVSRLWGEEVVDVRVRRISMTVKVRSVLNVATPPLICMCVRANQVQKRQTRPIRVRGTRARVSHRPSNVTLVGGTFVRVFRIAQECRETTTTALHP